LGAHPLGSPLTTTCSVTSPAVPVPAPGGATQLAWQVPPLPLLNCKPVHRTPPTITSVAPGSSPKPEPVIMSGPPPPGSTAGSTDVTRAMTPPTLPNCAIAAASDAASPTSLRLLVSQGLIPGVSSAYAARRPSSLSIPAFSLPGCPPSSTLAIPSCTRTASLPSSSAILSNASDCCCRRAALASRALSSSTSNAAARKSTAALAAAAHSATSCCSCSAAGARAAATSSVRPLAMCAALASSLPASATLFTCSRTLRSGVT
jgi:hypothetical protein